MRNVFAALVVLSTLSGCVALQQMSQSAANNAKPASAPVLTEHPSSSALWKDAPTTFHVGARSFALNVTSDLFNTVSVKLGGRQAVELPRGSFTDYRPIDRSQLAYGKVYFRLLSQSSDANRQTELDLLEIVDKDNAFIDAVPVVSTIDLVVGETSINPAYNGTPNSYKEGTWQVVLDRKEIGPPGSGGTSQCTFDLESTDPFAGADLGFRAPPGKQVVFNVPSNHCKSIGFWFKGQPTNMVEYPTPTAGSITTVSPCRQMQQLDPTSSSRSLASTCSSAPRCTTSRSRFGLLPLRRRFLATATTDLTATRVFSSSAPPVEANASTSKETSAALPTRRPGRTTHSPSPATPIVRWPAASVPHVLRMQAIRRVNRSPSRSAPLVRLVNSRGTSPMGRRLHAPGMMRHR